MEFHLTLPRSTLDPTTLWTTCRSMLRHSAARLAPSDLQLLHQVVGAGGDAQGFLYGGFTASVGLRATLMAFGKPIEKYSSILDYGCGSGRLTRWLADLASNGKIHGCDINGEAIAWCQKNLPFAAFSHNSPIPPLPYDSRTFDLILGVSVMTHLDEQMQLAWLEELARVCRPGAVVLLSVHGEDKASKDLPGGEFFPGDEFQRYLQKGHYYKRAHEIESVEGLPDFYQVAFHTKNYIERVWGRWFRVCGVVRNGPWYAQQMVVLELRGSAELATGEIDLPIGVIDHPSAASVQYKLLRFSGWAFDRHTAPVALELWLDDCRVGRCLAENERLDVQKAFYAANAERSGFSRSVKLSALENGPHMAWLSTDSSSFPICSSYFFGVGAWEYGRYRIVHLLGG